jgi:hypothetical protein
MHRRLLIPRAGSCLLVVAALLVGLPSLVAAQAAPCTAARPPERVRTTIDRAIPATGRTPSTPAVLTVTWRAPRDTPAEVEAYVVEAGSQRGLTDVASTRTAGPELLFVTPMPDGTYFVRVRAVTRCGVGAASPDAQVRVTGSVAPGTPNPLVILPTVHATRERLGNSAYVRVMGHVRNGWLAAPAALVTITARYEGPAGGLGVTQSTIASGVSGRLARSGLITDTVIPAGATGCFVLFAQFAQPTVTGLELVAAAGDVDAEPLPEDLVVGDPFSVTADAFGSLAVAGRVTNTGAGTVLNPAVWVEARDTAGQVLDCREALLEDAATELAANSAAGFRNVTEAPHAMSSTVRWWTTWTPADADRRAESMRYRALRAALRALLVDPDGAAPQALALARDAVRREEEALERAAAVRQ